MLVILSKIRRDGPIHKWGMKDDLEICLLIGYGHDFRNLIKESVTRHKTQGPELYETAQILLKYCPSESEAFADLLLSDKLKELEEEAKAAKSDFITRYCYSDEERVAAIEALGPDPEITRFKGLGEISPDEFKHFIGPDIRLEQVSLHKSDQVKELLEYYMGKNTMERQNFIINNLVIEEDRAEEDETAETAI